MRCISGEAIITETRHKTYRTNNRLTQWKLDRILLKNMLLYE